MWVCFSLPVVQLTVANTANSKVVSTVYFFGMLSFASCNLKRKWLHICQSTTAGIYRSRFETPFIHCCVVKILMLLPVQLPAHSINFRLLDPPISEERERNSAAGEAEASGPGGDEAAAQGEQDLYLCCL